MKRLGPTLCLAMAQVFQPVQSISISQGIHFKTYKNNKINHYLITTVTSSFPRLSGIFIYTEMG